MPLATPTVYIPTLTGGERLASCIEALRSQTLNASIVVADNGPGQGCAELLESRFPEVTRIGFQGRNLGFGSALNRAVEVSGEGPLIFLNDDAVPGPVFVEKLLDAWDGGRYEMIAGVLLNAAEPTLIDSAGIICDRTLTAWDYLTGEPVAALSNATSPLGPTGGAALFDRRAFETVGGFDERIFLYYEDLDLALRMRSAGMKCRLATEAQAAHERSATLGSWAAAKYYHTGFGRGYLLRKYRLASHPALAFKAAASDASAVLGQLVLDRSLSGGHGRIAGWRAGRDAAKRDLPLEYLTRANLFRHLEVRLARRGVRLPWGSRLS